MSPAPSSPYREILEDYERGVGIVIYSVSPATMEAELSQRIRRERVFFDTEAGMQRTEVIGLGKPTEAGAYSSFAVLVDLDISPSRWAAAAGHEVEIVCDAPGRDEPAWSYDFRQARWRGEAASAPGCREHEYRDHQTGRQHSRNESVLHHNAISVFVDIDPRTYCIDPDLIEGVITEHTRAVMPVHIHGMPADMDPILEIDRRHGPGSIKVRWRADARWMGLGKSLWLSGTAIQSSRSSTTVVGRRLSGTPKAPRSEIPVCSRLLSEDEIKALYSNAHGVGLRDDVGK